MRRGAKAAALTAAVLLAAAGCTNREGSPTSAVVASVRGLLVEPTPPPARTRAEIDALPFATLAASFGEDGPRAFLAAVSVADGYVTYSAADRRNLILHGAAVTSVRGVGSGLVSMASGPGADPLTTRMPLAEWPRRIVRSWRFSDDLGRETVRSAECRLTPVEAEEVEILERRYALVRVEERCLTTREAFTNLHWVEPETGFVWKTRQWIGDVVPPITVEILTPFE